jgi:NADH-quinone oxidoreductase subunit H
LATLFMAFVAPLGLYIGALVLFPLNAPERLDAMAKQWLGFDLAASHYRHLVYAVFLLLVAFVAVNFTAVFGGVSTWVERRIAGRMQSRIGPNRTSAAGFLAWVADAVKMVLKEDTVPASADQLLFRGAPYFSMVGLLLPFVVMPFGESVVATNMNVGVFYIMAVTAFVVVGILMSGWSSNSNWALFGAVRGAAQVISYEIPAGIALMVPVLMAGSLSMQDIVRAQGGMPWDWFVFRNPAAFVAFFISVTSSLAEGNRTPFDLPEAESELVAGYHAEYSGFRLAIFLMVEWANMWIMAGLAVTLFLGGWQVPFVASETYKAALGAGLVPTPVVVRPAGAVDAGLLTQDLGPRHRVHLAALDAASCARRSDDVAVLEVPGSRRVSLLRRDAALAASGPADRQHRNRCRAFPRRHRSVGEVPARHLPQYRSREGRPRGFDQLVIAHG